MADILAYADALAAHKRRHPADDVMSALVPAEIEGEKLTGEELRTFFFLLVIAGTDTTRSALPGGVLALAEHPDAYRRLRDDRALLGPAIEEMLRWHPPVLSFRRTATRDVELAGTMIRAGDKVVVYHVSAHYDEREFRDPLGFDVARAPNRHRAFGRGPHKCLGAGLRDVARSHGGRSPLRQSARGHIASLPPRQPAPGDQAGPMAVAGQTFEHVTVSEEFAQLDRHSFGQRLKEHFRRPGEGPRETTR